MGRYTSRPSARRAGAKGIMKNRGSSVWPGTRPAHPQSPALTCATVPYEVSCRNFTRSLKFARRRKVAANGLKRSGTTRRLLKRIYSSALFLGQSAIF